MATDRGSDLHAIRAATMDQIKSGLGSARVIMLTVNVICAFLFLMVFELMFGWQAFRPGASVVIFAEKLAALSSIQIDTTFSERDRNIVSLSRFHARRVLLDAGSTLGQGNLREDLKFGQLRDSLKAALSTFGIWKQEEELRTFVSDIDSLKSPPMEGRQAAQIGTVVASVLQIAEAQSGCTPTVGVVNSTDRDSSNIQIGNYDRPSNSKVSYYLQEILDRLNVNEETRGRRVGMRKLSFPITGTVMQVEDISLPVAVLLVLLAFWMYIGLMRVFDATKSLLKQYRRDASDLDRSHAATGRSDISPVHICDRLHVLVNDFHFMRMRKIRRRNGEPINDEAFEPVPDLGILWLISSPYLVVVSSILVNFHETFVLDLRWHASAFHFGSSPIRAFFVIYALLIACGIYLARLAFRTGGAFIDVQQKIQSIFRESLALCRSSAPATTLSEDDREFEVERRKRLTFYLGPTTFAWIAVSPFVLFGSYSALYITNNQFLNDYFLNSQSVVMYLVLLASYAIGFRFVMSRRAPIPLRYVSMTLVFVMLPVALLIACVSVGQFPPEIGHWPIIPALSAAVGIVIIGWTCGVFRLLGDLGGGGTSLSKYWRLDPEK